MMNSNIIHTIHDVIYTPAEGQDLSEMHLKKILINVNKINGEANQLEKLEAAKAA